MSLLQELPHRLDRNREVISIVGKRVKGDEKALKVFLEALKEAEHQHVLRRLDPTLEKHGM